MVAPSQLLALQLPVLQFTDLQSVDGNGSLVGDRLTIGLYLTYAVIAVGLVVWLARTLHRNGAVFLDDVFEDHAMAEAVNHLLVVGFYLLNLGYALLIYKMPEFRQTSSGAVNHLVTRVGALLLSLGVIHLLNMMVFWRIRGTKDRAVRRSNFIPPAVVAQPPAPQPSAPQPPAAPQPPSVRI